jgi:hypothetical protein
MNRCSSKALTTLSVLVVLFAVTASAQPVSVVEYYSKTLDAYFITGRTAEKSALDSVPDFLRTGMRFTAAPALFSGSDKVCRFYISLKTPFVSSHYYGLQSATSQLYDCEWLRANPQNGFSWEGYDFGVSQASAGAVPCPDSTTPIYRSFRAGANGKTSNHRYTASPQTYQASAAFGYNGESVVFCASAASTALTTKAGTAIGAMPSYLPRVTTSTVIVPPTTPLPSERSVAVSKQYFYRYSSSRNWVVVDLNGDGLDDLMVAPSLFDQKPDLPIEFWINQGDGTFANQTSTYLEGTIPKTGYVVSIVVADFNGDGRPDLFLSDSGQETTDCTKKGCPGARNTLMLSQPSGRYRDASASLANNAVARFNHIVSGTGDVNGDGKLDIAIPSLGEEGNNGGGVILQMGTGAGAFQDASSRVLSDEVGWREWSYVFSGQRPPSYDRHYAGAATAVDLDGDGVAELLTCSYDNDDRFSKKRTLRVSKFDRTSSTMIEVAKIPLPDTLASISGNAVSFLENASGRLGCSGIQAADIDGDGVMDLMLAWENWGGTYVQILKGNSPFSFTDVTLTALGGYATNFQSGGYERVVSGIKFIDVNGDGYPDVVFESVGVTATMLASGNSTVWINNGRSVFTKQRLASSGKPVAVSTLQSALGCVDCSYNLLFGRFIKQSTPSAQPDMLLLSTSEDLSAAPAQERSVRLRVLTAQD